jgi:ABC-type molybdate transport system substrate-binding protein
VRYEIAVVASSPDKAAARAFVAKATGPAGRKVLAGYGFRFPAPPKPKPAARR